MAANLNLMMLHSFSDEQVAEQKKRKEQEDILRKSLDGPGLYQRQGTLQRAEKNASSSISNSNAKQVNLSTQLKL